MSVLSVTEKFDRRRSSYRDGKYAHTRIFGVKTSDARDGTGAALQADDGVNRIPRPGDYFLNTRVTSIEADPVANSATHFEITVESTDGDDEQYDLHPLDRPVEFSWGSAEGTESYFMDCGDADEAAKPVANSAGDPFEQFMERESGSLVITLVRNEDYFDAVEADDFANTINLDYVTLLTTTFSQFTLKLSPIQASRAIETWQGQQVEYFRKTYTLKAKRDGWLDRPLDLGLHERFDATVTGQNGQQQIVYKKRPIVDSNGLPVKKPVPLQAGKVKVLSPSTPPEEVVTALTFRPYRKMNWGSINLLVVT